MIRISAGEFKGLCLEAPGIIRPTGDKVRQAVMNIFGAGIQGARVIDGYAGSGALGIESLSRGAAYVAFIESEPQGFIAIRDNLARLEGQLERHRFRVLNMLVERGLYELAKSEPPFDIILFDPPYHTGEGRIALSTVAECAILSPSGVVMVEHHRRDDIPESAGVLRRFKQHRYGDTVLSFYQAS